MNKYLYLLRHARAEPWNPLDSDFSRVLSGPGIQHARALADWMGGTLAAPDTVLSSPADRARQTLAPLLSQWRHLLASTHYIDAMYGASLDVLFALAEDAFSYADHLLMVGHNPGFHQLLLSMLKPETAARIRKMPTGTLAVIGFPGQFSRERRDGRLIHFVRRKDLT